MKRDTLIKRLESIHALIDRATTEFSELLDDLSIKLGDDDFGVPSEEKDNGVFKDAGTKPQEFQEVTAEQLKEWQSGLRYLVIVRALGESLAVTQSNIQAPNHMDVMALYREEAQALANIVNRQVWLYLTKVAGATEPIKFKPE